MRLIVAKDRNHQKELGQTYPEDKVVCFRDPLYAIQVTEIVDLTGETFHYGWDQMWWNHAQCRVKPS